jgi:hypothetical protein
MNKSGFETWLQGQGQSYGTIKSRISNCQRIERFEGDLDTHFANDEMRGLLNSLDYSRNDESAGIDVKHNILIKGNVYNGTATFRAAAKLYLKYKLNISNGDYISSSETQVREQKEKTTMFAEEKASKIDSYQVFLDKFNIDKESLYQFGIENTILPEKSLVEKSWEDLKHRVYNNQKVAIRGAGRNTNGTSVYLAFYEFLFGNNNIQKDPTNNANPQRIIYDLTGYKKNETIFNYQVSHIFGRSKNPLLFEAPWNIALVPKIIDPLTGHETKGVWPIEYQKKFYHFIYSRYSDYIDEYNNIVTSFDLKKQVEIFLENLDMNNFEEKYIDTFSKNIFNELGIIEL